MYQKLLEESQRALEIWNVYRAEIRLSGLIGKEAVQTRWQDPGYPGEILIYRAIIS